MKRMKLAALALCLGLSVCACGNAGDDNKTGDSSADVNVEAEADKDTAESQAEADNEVKDDASDKDAEATNENEVKDENKDETEVSDGVSLEDIYAKIEAEVELVSPMRPGANLISNVVYGVNVDELVEYVCEMPQVAESGEFIFLAKTNGADQADSLKGALESYKSEQATMMQDYLPAEYDIINESEVVITGDYVYLVISHNADQIISIIESSL